jgi:hypothetical protein
MANWVRDKSQGNESVVLKTSIWMLMQFKDAKEIIKLYSHKDDDEAAFKELEQKIRSLSAELQKKRKGPKKRAFGKDR